MQCVLGVDGGNTKTLALVAALDGTILGAGRGGCGDIYNAKGSDGVPDGGAAALVNIERAVMEAVQVAQVKATDLVTAVFNMAGADWPEDFAFLRTGMEARGFGRTILVQNDALGVLHAEVSSATGVSVVCGTGGAIGARAPDGQTWHSSRWQDEVQGSHQLGQKALYAIYRSALGMEPPTTLTAHILDVLRLHSVEEVLHRFTSREERSLAHTDRLTPVLLDEAQAGDLVARRVLQEHGRALGKFARAAARHVDIEGTAFALVLAGGVFRHPSTVLPDAIIEIVQQTSPAAQPMRCRYEPIIGVLLSALEAAGVAIDAALLANLVPTLPAVPFFATDLSAVRR